MTHNQMYIPSGIERKSHKKNTAQTHGKKSPHTKIQERKMQENYAENRLSNMGISKIRERPFMN